MVAKSISRTWSMSGKEVQMEQALNPALANGYGADALYIVYEREASADEGSSQSVLANDPGADAP
jgi:hypothetical protein